MTHSIVLTGASSGIGAALAEAYAAPGISMLLIARDKARLAEVADLATAKGASVHAAELDVSDEAAMRDAIIAWDDQHPVDIVIANAGIALGGMPEPQGQARRQVEINLMGTLHTVEPLIPRMIERKAGRIALVSSIAAIRPSGDLPSYSASKAGVRAYGQGIRSWLRGKGVSVTVICPGFVTSPMSARHHGRKPFEITSAEAAQIMKTGIAKKRGALTFPWQFALMIFLGNRLPPFASDWFERHYAAKVDAQE